MKTRTDIAVRPSRQEDLARITEIYTDAVQNGTASFELDPPAGHEMARRRTALL